MKRRVITTKPLSKARKAQQFAFVQKKKKTVPYTPPEQKKKVGPGLAYVAKSKRVSLWSLLKEPRLDLARRLVQGGHLPDRAGAKCACGGRLGDLQCRADQPTSHPYWQCGSCRARCAVTKGTWADVNKLPLQAIAGIEWLFANKFSSGPVSPADAALILGCSTQPVLRVFRGKVACSTAH